MVTSRDENQSYYSFSDYNHGGEVGQYNVFYFHDDVSEPYDFSTITLKAVTVDYLDMAYVHSISFIVEEL